MNLQGALTIVQQGTYLSTSDNLVFNFFINAEGDYLRRAKSAIRRLYRETHSRIESFIISNAELIKFIINTLPTVVKVLAVLLPLILQRKITNAA